MSFQYRAKSFLGTDFIFNGHGQEILKSDLKKGETSISRIDHNIRRAEQS